MSRKHYVKTIEDFSTAPRDFGRDDALVICIRPWRGFRNAAALAFVVAMGTLYARVQAAESVGAIRFFGFFFLLGWRAFYLVKRVEFWWKHGSRKKRS